ncbi:hypothetical protein HG535_0H02780 [Zygotorulaspora mrakii]|uniref:Inner membrane assembly complex subunit 17 n=1 Tax=Zygotorulaspora mrakii TaxID=42260 RepID=A0A7H9B878_ZYGMR|nr:uncharacterized protein HG535_0H02780 [Zygotorulaspora mrakii]QLG74951.1 hypothetical protein HG535_0H02780 [Zygotorulaspora mrakii]
MRHVISKISPLVGARTQCSQKTVVLANRVLRRSIYTKEKQNVRSLEDLAKLQSLDGVDPELIKKLINERTSELNIKDELEMLKNFNKEDALSRESPLKRFTRPLWIFMLMSSTVYLFAHFIWWDLEYDERDIELATQVEKLEEELQTIIKNKSSIPLKRSNDNKTNSVSWYKRWFW